MEDCASRDLLGLIICHTFHVKRRGNQFRNGNCFVKACLLSVTFYWDTSSIIVPLSAVIVHFLPAFGWGLALNARHDALSIAVNSNNKDSWRNVKDQDEIRFSVQNMSTVNTIMKVKYRKVAGLGCSTCNADSSLCFGLTNDSGSTLPPFTHLSSLTQ